MGTGASDSIFLTELSRRTLIFDGAMGTSIHALDLPLSDYQGLENCSEILTLTRPDAIEQIHRQFLEVGCDAVETNTFGGMPHVLAEFGLESRTREINRIASEIARRATAAYSTPSRPRFVVGSIGPGTKLITLRQIDYETMVASYREQAMGLLEGGCDVLLIETCQDILQCKTAIEACREAMQRVGRRVPLMVQITMETTGTMLVGTDIAAALTAIEAYPEVDVIGLNCATGPREMSEHIRHLARFSSRPISVLPNAGLPMVVDGKAHFPLTPDELAHWLREFVATDGVGIVGGCCGTTPAHMRAVAKALGGQSAPKRAFTHEPACSSIYQATPYRQDNSFLIVGERCNTNGSKRFKQMLADGDLDGCVSLAVEQVREEGAHVLDVCVDYVGRDGTIDMKAVVDRFAREVTAPLMLDSTQLDVLETGLQLAGGKCIVNSVNLEDGEEKLAKVAGLCRKYGAAVVALVIDEDPVEAMAKTAERKLAIATRIRNLLVDRHGMNEEDIFWDCLTFPITTGNESDRRLALETLDGIQRVMNRFPRCQSILGVSNVSFGLAPLARVVLNSVFLSEARERGLTAAIVHAGKILPRNRISDERWNAALDLIHDRREAGDPLERFIGLFATGEALAAKVKISDLPVEERLKQRIVDGNRTGLEADLDEAMGKYPPLEIINTLLLDGMKTVGELFGSGQMQLPFVLKSAETMKSAVAHLEPHMEKSDGASRGKIVLATVRGDVHDIGKNLVDIILTNNGYTVYNLGIKQPINNIIEAWRQHRADAIGLSGLLVKSTLVMRDDLGVLNEQGITAPVILGGAALTRRYVEDDLRSVYKGSVYYARDAFEGLSLMGAIAEGRPVPAPSMAKPQSAVSGDVAQPPSAVSSVVKSASKRPAATPIPIRKRNLPHIEPGSRAVFVTFRTADRRELPPEVRALVMKHCLHDHGKRLQMFGAVVMPDHAHLIFAPMMDESGAPFPLAQIMSGIKGSSAHSINKLLGLKGAVWQDESFDHILRSDEDVRQKVLYVCENPVRAGLARSIEEYPWKWRSWIEGDERGYSGGSGVGGRSEDTAEGGCAASNSVVTAGSAPATADSSNLERLAAEIEQRYGLRDLDDEPANDRTQPGAAVPHQNPKTQPGAAVPHLPDAKPFALDHPPTASPPFWGDRMVEKIALRAALSYINETMLFQVQWGFRKKGRSPAEWKQYLDSEVRPTYRGLVERCEREEILDCRAVYGYWPCASQGDDLIVFEPPSATTRGDLPRPTDLRELARFTFPRQGKPPHRCLADFWRPVDDAKSCDVVAFHIVTAGRRVSEVAREWFAKNDYQQYLFLHGLGVETAEALAEYIHRQVRIELGVADKDARDLQMLFKQGYQGSRFSFGYPACPRLEDQATLMKLLRPERIGIELSDEFQLEPEQSTSAIISIHPQARYFNVR